MNWVRFHKWATISWATLGLAASILWMKSVPWVVFMSLWANIVGHWSSYQAARSEAASKQQQPHTSSRRKSRKVNQ